MEVDSGRSVYMTGFTEALERLPRKLIGAAGWDSGKVKGDKSDSRNSGQHLAYVLLFLFAVCFLVIWILFFARCELQSPLNNL